MVYGMKQLARLRGFDEEQFVEWANHTAKLHGAFADKDSGELIVTTWNVDELLSAARNAGFTRIIPR